ncbi:MAG: acyl-CoA dehydrogenase [Hydrogenophaga sp.]|uniref:acyl-CoA dehydrogenase n=1 Tax=Hydrogenophaga sp. TaxID=1904254 RepID=UPI00271D4E2F|nr:acyl-CoA dehydrogenase [Hydrogenophaga sp.]MDO9149066.1 acyl-CoA dehydrogenase [Hydrogenophaga sp.]MDO9606641.1 acyl-CoA dehydrogenase [Hydrogenophaga sp.]MDP2162765.1 acyl-CoA dehydrogenase [Hydrogenophaga sp.]MDP3476936.1 acyl-CoA dehydrogenase [Hydrogenophaga sp.]
MSLRPTLDFLLHDWLGAESLNQRERFADHSRETFDAVLDTCERIAREKYAPFNRLVDTQEPQFDGERVILPQATHDAQQAYAASGMLSAAQDYAVGGMQLPYTVEAASNAFFAMASVSIGSGMLTTGNANLLMKHGTEAQQRVFALNEFNGRFSGTMCLSEPQAGSSLSDVVTRAVPDGAGFEADPLGPRYRLKGNKMWISAGEHELTENIIHLVLAKIPDEHGKLVPGTRGISLFIVPKKLVDTEGQLTGERNDVALAGLNHKCGWRGTTNTLLNFGEGKYPVKGEAGAVGYLVGQPGRGLHCMFHMMNEARIGVGLAATMLGMAGYHASLDYAKNRPQGRPMGTAGKDPAQPPVRIIEHADVKRMLLAQKSYCEGALALELYCARLVDEQHTGDAQAADDARLLLEVLTPIAKSWPSEWCLEANSLAIQVHGGYGYTRDFPVEQYWRDNRLNMIHEGTHGIQGMDLLGRKVLMENGKGLQLLAGRINATIERAIQQPELAAHANALGAALAQVGAATKAAWATGNPQDALANAVPYMQAFGHTVLAWIWLDVALAAHAAADTPARTGRLAAMRFFFHYELPKIGAWLQVVSTRDQTCASLPEEAF